MFGFKRIFRKFTQPSSDTNIAPMTIVGDYTKESEEQSITPYAAPVSKGAESGIITLPLLSHYSNLARGYESMYNDGLVGQRDGVFPVTNPVDGKIYFHPASKKYYLCTQSYTGTVEEPGGENGKFSELTLYNVSKTGGTKQVTISGVITGNGTANESGVINITSAYGAMSSYAKGTASAVTTSDTPITAIGKLEALLDTKSASNHNHDTVYSKLNHTHVWANITDRPSTLPNPNGLVIKLNGGSGKTYTGSEAVEIDITPSAIGAQVAGEYASADHNHNGVYAPVSHTHSEYQPKGDYALSSHNHDNVYAKLSHTHTIDQIGALTGYKKAEEASAVGAEDSILIAIGKLEKALDTKQNSGSYAPASHTHVWANITDRPSALPNPNKLTIKLNGGSPTDYTGAEAKEINITPASIGAQVAGDYAAASHNHNGVYAPVSHSHSEYLPLAGGSLTGDVIVPKDRGFKYYDSEGTAKWLISNNNGTEIALGYDASGQNVIVRAYNEIYAMKDKKVWHEGNFNPSNYSAASHNHDDRYFTESEINDKLSGYAVVGHNHDTAYAKISHTHTEYQPKGDYAASNHNHDSVYAKISHSHTIDQIGALTGYEKAESAKAVTAEDTILVAIGKLEKALDGKQGSGSYAPASHTHVWANITDRPSTLPNPHALTISLNGKAQTAYTGSAAVEFNITPASIGAQVAGSYASASHNHDGVYQPAGDYALADHNHDETYSKIGHTHSEYALTSHNHSGVYAPVSHTHTISQIGALTGYKIGSVEALSEEDTILAAFGKLEASVNSKQAAGSYAPASHNHDTVYAKISHTHTEYQPKGDYAAASHTHDDRYYTESEINSKLSGYATTGHTHTGYLSTSGGTISGALTVTGQILSNADVVAYSDARFKTNLRKIEDPISKLNSISGYHYDMLGVENNHQVGVIAQEVEKILPEAVFHDNNGHMGVRYTNLIPLLIEGFKEQQIKINKQDEIIESLIKRIEKLEGGAK